MKWLVTWECKTDGREVAEPSVFHGKRDAKDFIKETTDALLPGNRIALYRCKLVKKFERKQ